MSLPQENFDAAVAKATSTLGMLDMHPQLAGQSPATLQSWLWDLEAIAAALRHELANRSDSPVDFG